MPAPEDQAPPSEVGVETEEDATTPSGDEIRKAYVTGSDWTTETIMNQLRKGNINLNPIFQRREVWTRPRKSLLIESIVLNLPIPQIVLAERKDRPHTYIVLDGKQRLLTIRQFCVNSQDRSETRFEPLFLEKLTLRADLNGESYETLNSNPDRADIVDAFDNHTIRTVVIRNWPDDDYLHRVFLRLNTGSVQLSPQELRQALIPGPFTDFLDEFATTSTALQGALGIDGPDFRMRDNEIFLRYMAFATRAETYAGNLKGFLDKSAEVLNERWSEDEDELKAEAERCNAAIVATQKIFGKRDSFSTYNEDSFGSRFNRAVFDIMTFFFRDETVREAAIQSSGQVKKAFIDLSKSDSEFLQSLTTTTKSKKATATRFVTWAKELTTATGQPVAPPKNFSQLLKK